MVFSSPLVIFAQDGFWIKKVTFRGNKIISNDVLAEQISIHGISTFNKSVLRKDPILYDSELVDRARRNLTIHYQREGFLNVRIQEAYLAINEKNSSVEILFNIIEGDPILVNNVDFEYLSDGRPEFELLVKNMTKDLSLKNRKRFRETADGHTRRSFRRSTTGARPRPSRRVPHASRAGGLRGTVPETRRVHRATTRSHRACIGASAPGPRAAPPQQHED